MKVLCSVVILSVTLYFASASYKSHEDFKKASAECIKEMKLDEKAMEEYLKSANHETTDENKKCYLKCVLEKTDWMDKDGKIEEPKDHGMPEDYAKLMKECEKDLTGKDHCDKAYNFHICSFNKTMELHHKKHPQQ